MYLDDRGDNPGLDSVIAYQDGRQVEVRRNVSLNYGWLWANEFIINGIKPGKHEIKFKVKDKGGNVVESEPFEIQTGPYSQPKIEKIK